MSTHDQNEETGNGPVFSATVPTCVSESCYEHRGVIMPNFMPVRCLQSLENFKVRPDDVFVITYPKSGTTWAQQVALLARHDGDLGQLADKHVMMMVPFLEIVVDISKYETSPGRIEQAEVMPSQRILKTHCMPDWMPEDIRSDAPKAKVIYVVRNPKDTAVSYYHFCHYVKQLPSYESWDVFFEEFISGRAPQGPWFQHVLPWWERRNHPNVLFLKYEDMKKDLRGAVNKIVKFMGKSFSDDVIDEIVSASSFDKMKKSPSSNPDFLLTGHISHERSFMRKGVVGDWKNYFSEDQNRRFDELYEREMANSGLILDFD